MKQSYNKIKKVAYIYDGTEFGGVEIYVLNLLKHIDRTRYLPCVVIPGFNRQFSPPRFIEEVQNSDFELLIAPDPGNSRGLSFVKDVWNLVRIFKENNIDIIHIQTSNHDGGKRPILAAKLAGIKAILRTEHVTPSLNLKLYSRYIIKPFDLLTDYIITTSNATQNEQIKLLGRNPKKIYRSYSGIEIDHFNTTHNISNAKRALGLDPVIPVIGMVGRMVELKGHSYLINAAPRLIKEYGPINFLIVGEGELEQQLKEKVSILGLSNSFQFLGYKSDPRPYIEAMDITVMCSRTEAFGLALVEFMAMGKPSVVTDIPSFKEIVIDGESGLIVPVNNVSALADGILQILRNPNLAQKLGREASKRVRKEFSIQRLADDMMNLYDSLLGLKINTPVLTSTYS